MSHQAQLSWTAPSDATGSSTYNIYRATASCPASGISGPTWTKIGTGITTTTYTDSTVAVGTTYCYYGTQVLNGAESVPSNTAGGSVGPNSITIQLVLS